MLIDKGLTWRNIASHQDFCHIGGHAGIFDLHTLHHPSLRVQGSLPELLGIHLTETFVSLECEASRFMALTVFLKSLIIVEIFLLSFLRHYLIKRWHGNIHMSLIDKLRHKTVKQGQKQSRDMSTVHIRIGHDHDLVIAKLRDIKIISVSFRKTATKSIDHSLDLCVGQHLVNGGLLYIEDLTPDRKDCLIVTVSGCLGRTAGGISLYDKDLTQ